MSYLNPLRLHFAGRFQANVSTVNNDPEHFRNDTFVPDYQKMQTSTDMNGWFNPEGDAGWRLRGCKVTSAWTPDGEVSNDPILQHLVADAEGRVCAKLADLDPEQQLVSQIWGLQVRICDASGNTLVSGDFEPVAFMDIWNRATGGGGGDIGASAAYQSVLSNLKWFDVSRSPFLTELKAQSGDLLSIKFNLNGFNMSFSSPDFMTGRIVGTIRPATMAEPKHMLIARQFMAANQPGNQGFFEPLGGLNFFPAVVDEASSSIFLDLGNAITTPAPGGPMNNLGDLILSYEDTTGKAVELAKIPSTGAGGYAEPSNPKWYEWTGGVVVLPLTADQINAISNCPLTLSGTHTTDKTTAAMNNVTEVISTTKNVIRETPSGAFVRADTIVYRLSPGDTPGIELIATRFGKVLPNTNVYFKNDPSQLQAQASSQIAPPDEVPQVGVQATALGEYRTVYSTDANGRASISFTVSDPGTPRNFSDGSYGIDGQVYGLRPTFEDGSLNPPDELINESNFVSILLWSGFTPSTPPTWEDLQPIFQQYANLYPVMGRFLDMGNLQALKDNAALLKLAFALPVHDPNSMPVTRDLSPAKRKAILDWLEVIIEANPAKPYAHPVHSVSRVSEDTSITSAVPPHRGGKAEAMARRNCVNQ